jgi:hypothetical protein
MKKLEQHTPSEFERFDDSMRKILSVSHKELQERENRYKKNRAKKKRAKS